jgi:hypothetical protein
MPCRTSAHAGHRLGIGLLSDRERPCLAARFGTYRARSLLRRPRVVRPRRAVAVPASPQSRLLTLRFKVTCAVSSSTRPPRSAGPATQPQSPKKLSAPSPNIPSEGARSTPFTPLLGRHHSVTAAHGLRPTAGEPVPWSGGMASVFISADAASAVTTNVQGVRVGGGSGPIRCGNPAKVCGHRTSGAQGR